jgi:hypothetical protein
LKLDQRSGAAHGLSEFFKWFDATKKNPDIIKGEPTMIDTEKLQAAMILNNDTVEGLSAALGRKKAIDISKFDYRKKDMEIIKDRYALTPNQCSNIFFGGAK